jgi:protein-disulfide isomerase
MHVEFVIRDYPLDTGCNNLTATAIVSQAGCEAARAAKFVAKRLGPDGAKEFAEWLYARSTVLSERLIRLQLDSLGILPGYLQSFEELETEVAADVDVAHRLGVGAVPTYFLNGVRMPGSNVAFESILQFEQSTSSTALTSR